MSATTTATTTTTTPVVKPTRRHRVAKLDPNPVGMGHFFRTAFTGADNSSVDLGRVLWGVSTVAFLSFELVAIFRGATFEPMTFAGALSTLAIGHGASLRLKGETEPEPETK